MRRAIASRLPDERLAAGEERLHAAEIAACLQAEIGTTSGARSWNGSERRLRSEDLKGARVVVTRPRRQAGPLIDRTGQARSGTAALPTIRIEPIGDMAQLGRRD